MPRELARRANGKLLAGVLIGAVLGLIGFIGYIYVDSRNEIDRTQQALDRAEFAIDQAEEAIKRNTTSLQAHCIQRAALDRQIARSAAFLKANPRGPIFGIPRNLLVANLDQIRRERRGLRILDCKEEP